MAKKFSITNSMLNEISKNTKKSQELEAKEKDNIQYIDIDNIEPSDKNFYEITGIDELATDIRINGLNHNLVVRPLENEKYEIISGERRYTALRKLVDEGENDFKYIRCLVKDINDLDSEIILIQANAQTRELSEYEKIKQVERLNILYKEKKAKGEQVGKIRSKIAKDLNISEAQVQRLTSANEVIPELLELVKDKQIATSSVSILSSLSGESQLQIAEIIKAASNSNDNGNLVTRDETEKLKKQFQDLESKKAAEIDKLKNENQEIKQKIDKNNFEIESKITKKIEEKYLNEIKRLKEEKIKEIKEKEELKKKIKEVDKNNLELKNNIIVNTKIKEIKTSVSSLYSIIEEMKKNHHILDEEGSAMIDELIESLEFIKDMK